METIMHAMMLKYSVANGRDILKVNNKAKASSIAPNNWSDQKATGFHGWSKARFFLIPTNRKKTDTIKLDMPVVCSWDSVSMNSSDHDSSKDGINFLS